MPATRSLDLVLQGATGFTGHLAAEEIAKRASSDLRWAVAGRDPIRTKALAQRFGVESVLADGLDKQACEDLAASTAVVISCAGPFTRYGKHLVDACVASGTHYADISGEMPWIDGLVKDHHQTCTRTGTVLVPASGFDSVPSDLAVHALQQEIPAGTPIHGFFTIRGGFNGGTLHSGIALSEDHGPNALPRASGSGPPFPVPALSRWATPFLMAPVNEATVARSRLLAADEGGCPETAGSYREFMAVRGRLRAYGLLFGLRRIEGMFRTKWGRSMIQRFGPAPGQGPDDRSIEDGFAKLTLLAGSLENPEAKCTWLWNGDPSNRITVRCLVQTGLALAAGEAQRGGVLTPAAAFGDGLLKRLTAMEAVRETRS